MEWTDSGGGDKRHRGGGESASSINTEKLVKLGSGRHHLQVLLRMMTTSETSFWTEIFNPQGLSEL